MGRLAEGLTAVATAAGERLVSAAGDRMAGATGRLTEYAKNSGRPGLVAAATGAQQAAKGKSSGSVALKAGLSGIAAKVKRALGAGTGTGKGKVKVTNIVESIDVGVPVRLAYDQWTRFSDWPSFMKKVETVQQDGDEKLSWRAQIFWSHRSWESTIVEQVPDKRIVWRSDGAKGSVDGSVSFHELAPELTRILLVLEYHPKGLFEHTGNIWRAQGRRTRLELKHFRRHVATSTLLHQDEVEGWPGEIHDAEVTNGDAASTEGESESGSDSGSRPEGRGRQNKGSAQQPGRRRTSESGASKRPAEKSASARSGASRKPPAKKTARSGS